MKTVKFYGSSDDNVCFTNGKGWDEKGCYQSGSNPIHAVAVVGGLIKVYCIYDGCWHFSVGQVDEDMKIPVCDIRFVESDKSYSVMLEIDVPDDRAHILWEEVGE